MKIKYVKEKMRRANIISITIDLHGCGAETSTDLIITAEQLSQLIEGKDDEQDICAS